MAAAEEVVLSALEAGEDTVVEGDELIPGAVPKDV